MKLNESIIKNLNEGRNDEMEIGTITSDKGKGFYVGDPCYVLPDEIYHGIWGDQHDYGDGLIETPEGNWLVHGTLYGDGCYGNNGEYPVDSGTLSVIPAHLIAEDKAKDALRLGRIFPGTEASAHWYGGREGIFSVTIQNPNTSIEIMTGEPEESEEDWNEEEYEEESWEDEE